MALTAKQEGFAQSVADGLSQADAYRANYRAGGMSDKQVWEEASKLAKNPKVSQRLQELRDSLAAEQLWTRADSVNALKKVLAGDSDAAHVSAVKELNAMHGFNAPSAVDLNVKGRLAIDPDRLSDAAKLELLNAATDSG